MVKLRKLLVVYIALVVTLLTALLLYQVRVTAENSRKVVLATDKIEKELEKLAQYQESAKLLLSELEEIKKDSASKSQQVLGQTQETSPSPQVSLGFITISDSKWQNIDIYEAKSASSKPIGKAEFGKAYRYFKKEDVWYQIMMPKTEKTGWVSSRFFKELSDNAP